MEPSHRDAVFARAWRLGDEVLVIAANTNVQAQGRVTWRLPEGVGVPEVVVGKPLLVGGVGIDAEGVNRGDGESIAVRLTMP